MVTTSTIEQRGTAYLTSRRSTTRAGQQVETQDETPDGNMDVTMAFYNSDGWEILESNSFYAAGAPPSGPDLGAAKTNSVPDQTGYVYDGAGRVTRQVTYSGHDRQVRD